MLRRDGIAKVLDFGIARQGSRSQDSSAPTHAALPTLTGTGVSIGTPQYMAPEQIKGKKLDGRTDQFAWAVTAYEALAGRLPWQAENGALGIVASILEEVPPPVGSLRADVPLHVSAAIARAMAKRPDDRFATMQDLVAALDGRASDESAPGPAPQRVSFRPPAGGSNVHETRFSEATVKAVIGKALSFEEQGGYSKNELRDAALELGISEAALEGAASAIRAERQSSAAVRAEEPIKERIRQRRRRSFVNHLIAYLGVNLIIIMPIFMKGMDGKIAPLFVPAIAWGIALAIHALKAFSADVGTDEIRKEIEREDRAVAKDAARRAALAGRLEKQARRNRMKHDAVELGSAVEEGVASLLSQAARRIREGAEPPPPVPVDPRVRVAQAPVSGPAAHDSAFIRAEAEAQAEAEQARAHAARRVHPS